MWALGGLLAFSAAIAGASGGCAKGTSPTTGSDGAAGAGNGTVTGSGGAGGGPVGKPCETAQDCPEGGECVQIGGKKMCTVVCPPDCPSGTYCTLIEGDPYCVPDVDQQCGQCLGSAQCKGITDQCLTAPAGDKFCARDCTVIDDCPAGFVCMERADYDALVAGNGSGSGAGGGGDGGSGGAGGAGTGSGAGTTTSVGTKPSGIPHKFCVPPDGLSCPCDEKRDGVTKSCDVKNAFGHCPGSETCDPDGGGWIGCTAKTPVAELCNADDDDCNGAVDEGEPNAMCGGAPPNAQWACTAGACSLAGCDPGWAQYPPGAPEDGCTCPVDTSEPNDTCATAASAGQVMDTGGPVQIAGTLSSDTDVDVWTFDTVDVDEVTTNSYHVSIDVVGGEGSEDIVLDVLRGGTCMDAPAGPATSITSYDWCVDGKSADGTAGEAPCSATGPVHCNNNSAKYHVRVRRKPGAPGTCLPYKIQVSAKGGDPCDFAAKCP